MDLMYIFEANITAGTNQSNFLAERPDVAIPYLAVLGVVMTSGTLGNLLVIAAVLTNKHLKTEGNVFIVNLALADLAVTTIINPFSVAGVVLGKSWFESRMVLCKGLGALCSVACMTSLLTIGAISFNRYIHICHHSLYKSIYTFRNSVIICLGLWLCCIVFSLPNFFGWSRYEFDEKTLSCLFSRTDEFSFTLFAFCTVALPTSLTAFCYLLVFRHVQRSKKKVGAEQRTAGNKSKAKNDSVKLARTLFIIFAVFVVCWGPYSLLTVIDVDDKLTFEVHLISILFAHTNSSLNCILYGVTNQHFRRGYKKVLGIDRCARRQNKTTCGQSNTSGITGNTGTTTA